MDDALRHLESLELLESSQSYTASYATAAEFERKNVQYTLTARGEAEFAGVRVVLARLKEKGALQTAVPDAIADRLDTLHTLLSEDDPAADSRVFTSLGAGQAAVVTLDQISRTALAPRPAPVVYVVENPSVLALAQQRLGSECPPLVCVSGWPGSAAVALLQQLASDGTELRYHGDFDGEGLRIAAHVMARTGALPWRMGAQDYQEALSRVATAPPPGRMTPVPWDGELHEVGAERGVAVHEERVAETLLSDLRAGAAAR